MTDEPEDDVSALRAIAHPVRLRMLSLLTGTAMSAAELARELGISHANASYHLRQLLSAGELIDAGEERIRGGVAKRYRHPAAAAAARRAQTSTGDQVVLARAFEHEVERRLRDRAAGPDTGLSSDLEGWVTPAVWEHALGLLHEAFALLHAQTKPPRTPGTVHVSSTVWAFRMTPPEPPAGPPVTRR